MKNTNCEENNANVGMKTRIAKAARDLLARNNPEKEPSCNIIFLYEPEVPLEILMSQKEG